MILSKENLNQIQSENLIKPNHGTDELHEKVLQFGTGVLLRGLPDYFINKANQQGVFNGRVVVVKSTSGSTADFDEQDSLYTLCVRGIENGEIVNSNVISSAISRVISSETDWQSILEFAKTTDFKIVVSNTTEVGIVLVEESIHQNPPKSFPAKLLAVLYERYKAFNGSKDSGLVIIATELIPDNGKKLGEIVLQLANFNKLEAGFLTWLATANTFCNSLVDRIVPGKPDASTIANLQEELGYTDSLLSIAEPYRLWAIEGGKNVADALSFAKIDEGVVIADDIEIYRELKVRLLNGTHSLSSGIAVLAGIKTVKNGMDDELLSTYISKVMADEIGKSIPYEIPEKQIKDFANSVKDRFANPYVEHLWTNIVFQYTMKMKIRIVPLLLNYYKIFNKIPQNIAFGFATYLAYSRVDGFENEKYSANLNGTRYAIVDDSAENLYQKYQFSQENFVENVLSDSELWGADLTALPQFVTTVQKHYNQILSNGVNAALAESLNLNIGVL